MQKPRRSRVPAASFGRAPSAPKPSAWLARLRYLFAAIALCVLALLVYSNSFATAFALDSRVLLLGDHPASYHWVNFFLHSTNVLLAFALIQRLLSGHARAFQTALLVAGMWAAHPLLTESVTNLAGRPDLLAAVAALSGFLMYLKSAEADGWRRALWLARLRIATCVGAFSSEGHAVC